ncbi:MAG: MBL fold metallo-hydrolase [Thiobacillus sp. SCN 63-57]|uniref:MBL fold metallo-hydrolase n=1 Tax=Thiobacillus sp. SCN 63-57 TaxID=1660145 RepID=UPI00086E52CC|nr:MBL fold metallo-hydrolase [Thiobacillus sp. SCN 63-57]ODV03361.1 MAG: MBL fold metallo-hydrolase [Thiobacillus sp. SCN 63-57]
MIRLLFALLLLNLFPLAHATNNDVTVPMKLVRLGVHSYFVQGQSGAASSENQGFMSNAGFVVTRDGVVVFDALASPPLAEKLLGLIRTVTKQPIKRVIVSHYHADHFYGLQVFKAQGAEIWAQRAAEGATRTEDAARRLAQRKEALFPWVDDDTRLLEADHFVEGDTEFGMGGLHFTLRHVGPAHSSEDLAMLVKEDGVLYAGDVVFRGRVPFVGDADSRAWIAALDKLIAVHPRILVPGHGAPSRTPRADLVFTRDYLSYLRSSMGKAARNLVPFDEAYEKTDWSKYRAMPAFNEANRVNAYNQYLRLETEDTGK